MRPTDILKDEHRVIERVLDTLEKAANQLREGQDVSPDFFVGAADFIKGFADGCHHRKEEGVLFKAMAVHGMPDHDGPIGVMLKEHEEARRLTRGMRDGAERMAAGDAAASGEVASYAMDYVGLLRAHIQKEDNVLFPMADQIIPADEEAQVSKDFERLDLEDAGAGVREKFVALAEDLERQMEA